MKIDGTVLLPAKAERVWALAFDSQALMQVIPGLNSIEFNPNGEIFASVMFREGPLTGSLRARLQIVEEQKPIYLKIAGEGLGALGLIRGTCVIQATEQGDSTVLEYQGELQIAGRASLVGEQFLNEAIGSVLRRASLRLQRQDVKSKDELFTQESSNLDKATQTWDEIDISKVRQVAWSSIQYISHKFIGAFCDNIPLIQYVHEKLAESLDGNRYGLKGAALVCGDMEAERGFFETDQFLKFSDVDGFDISTVSLAKYQPRGVVFSPHTIDCNNLVLERDKYDLIVTSHGAHHVYNLGNLYYQANKALKPHGLFYMIEWIGPEYLQVPRFNHLVASILLLALFDRKTRTTHMGQLKGRWVVPSPESYEPSESCNSSELIPQFLKYFKPVKIVYFAGLSYPVFEGIAQNIDQSKLGNLARIRLVHALEQWLTRLGLVKPLFAIALAEKRQGIF